MSSQRIKIVAAGIVVAAILIFAVIWITKNNGDTDEIVDNKQNELLAEDGELFDYQNAGSVQIGDYKGIEVVIEPDDEDVDLELSSVLDDMKPIKTDTVIKKGDYAYIDFTGSLDGIELDDLQGEDVILVVGNYAYVQPFEDALLGKKVGQTYSVTIQFDEDYQDKTVAGREVVFQVTVKAKFDDKYAKKVSKGKYSDVASYRESLAKRLRKENKENLVELAWDELVENCEVSLYPKKLVKEEKKNLKMQYEAFAEVSGVSYDELMESLMMDDDSVTETAQDTVRDRMIAKSIAEWEKFSVTDDVCRKYLIQLMEYEEDDDETLEQLIEDYEEDYGSRPKDDVLVAMAKEFVAKNASVK